MTTVAIIPARGGSTRIPRKNIKVFHGQPIIAYSIETAKKTGLFDEIWVSTDCDAIAADVAGPGVNVWWRDPALGHNDVGTQEVAAEVVKGLGLHGDDIACCIYATSPLMSTLDLYEGHRLLTEKDCPTTYVISVGYPNLRDAAQFYWGWAENFLRFVPLIGPYTRMVKIADERICDINTPQDWDQAWAMYEALKK